MKQLRLVKLTILTLSFVSISSCQQQEFFQKEYLDRSSSGDDKTDQDKKVKDKTDHEKIEDVKHNCQNALESNTVLTKTVKVEFPAAIECNFNDNAADDLELNDDKNGSRIDGLIRAQARQDVQVSMSQDQEICDLNFDFPNQQMQYDDEILLLLNDYVIMSSQDFSQSDKHPTGLYVDKWNFQKYEWQGENSLFNLHYGWNYTPQYCLGVDSSDEKYDQKCHIPKTETVGELRLDIPKEEIIKIGVVSHKDDSDRKLKFSFVTTGDNDNGDCEHAAYGFDIKVDYIVKDSI